MMTVKSLMDWLSTMDPDDCVGVDEGGLSLVHVRNGEQSGAYWEIGGVSDAAEDSVGFDGGER